MSCTPQKSSEVYFERATPESVGMSSEKLANADAVINASSAEDLALLAAALMNGGKINGKSVLGKLTVETMTQGTAIVVDPVSKLGTGSVSKLRALVCNTVGAAVIE